MRSFDATPVSLTLKWPNDVLRGGQKLAGILLERADDVVIAGFGVNLVAMPAVDGRQVASLADAGLQIGPQIFCEALAATFSHAVAEWRSFGIGPVINAWSDCAHPVGTAMAVHGADGRMIAGSFAGLDYGGALRLRTADKGVMTINAGEIILPGDDDAARH